QQRQSIQRPQRVIGNDDDPAAGRNVLPITVTDAVAEIEIVQNLVDETETAQRTVLLEKTVDFLFVGELSQQAERRFLYPGTRLLKAGKFLVDCLFYVEHRRLCVAICGK